MRLLALVGVMALGLALSEAAMVCYYGSWAVYRPGKGKFDVEDIDPGICTHLVFGFAGLDGNTWNIKVLDPYNELYDNWGKGAFDRFTGLKQQNANLVTLLAVGGWNEGSDKYSQMAADASKRKIFIDSSIALLKAHNFDGLDMDWEYPTQRGGRPEDRVNFVTLLSELRTALHAEGMILTAAVSAGKLTVDEGYDVVAISQQLDIINLMSYDLHGSWETFTHHHAPLYAHPLDTGDLYYNNVAYAANYWMDLGAPANKLVLGMGLYGRCFTLDSQSNTDFYAPASQPGAAGPYTQSPGLMGFNEVCEAQLSQNWNIVHDPVMNEPYMYYFPSRNIWCGIDDIASYAFKAAFARDLGLLGTMVWSLETDDFHGLCGRQYNAIKTIVESFTGQEITPPPTRPPPSTTTRDPNLPPETTTQPTTHIPPVESVHCKKPGFNVDENDCQIFYQCVDDGQGGYLEYPGMCPPGTLFNGNAVTCDYTNSVCATGNCPNNCP